MATTTQKRILWVLLWIAMLAVSLLFFINRESPLRRVLIFFPDAGSKQIIVEERGVPFNHDNLYLLKKLVTASIQGPLSFKYQRSLPKNTELRAVHLRDNVALVDFSKEVQALDPEAPLSPRDRLGIIKRTILHNIPEISTVHFFIQGQELASNVHLSNNKP